VGPYGWHAGCCGVDQAASNLNLTPRGVSLKDEAFAGLPFPEQGGNILTASWVPATDVSEDANTIQITMELAGVNPEDVRISLESNVLTIRGEKRQEAPLGARTRRARRVERRKARALVVLYSVVVRKRFRRNADCDHFCCGLPL